jgi:hypothetical protein
VPCAKKFDAAARRGGDFSVLRFDGRKINKACNFRKTKEFEEYRYDL